MPQLLFFMLYRDKYSLFLQLPVMCVREVITSARFLQFCNRYIIVVTDYLTKWPEAEGIPNKEGSTMAKFLTKLVCRYSGIKVLITDQGREFCNHVNDLICQRVGIDHRTTTAYHPQSNGQTKRFNQSLCNAIVKYVNTEQNNWDDFIDPILLAYRTSPHKTTKTTPFQLAFGREPKLLIEETFPVGETSEPVGEDEALERRISSALKIFDLQQKAKGNIESAQVKQKEYFDKAHQTPTYKVGDLVLLNNARRNQRKGDKLAPRWTGPHEIIEVYKFDLIFIFYIILIFVDEVPTLYGDVICNNAPLAASHS